MNTKNCYGGRCRRKRLFANSLHKQTFFMVFLAALIPAIIMAVCLYYLIFGVTAQQLSIPEFIAYDILPAARKVTLILLLTAPLTILAIIIFAHKISHDIIGSFDRIIRELDEHIEGKREGHILIRKTDKFSPLVHRINKLLDKAKKG